MSKKNKQRANGDKTDATEVDEADATEVDEADATEVDEADDSSDVSVEKVEAPSFASGEQQHNTAFEGQDGDPRDASGRFTANSPVLTPAATETESDVVVESVSNATPPQRAPRPIFPSGEVAHNTHFEHQPGSPDTGSPEAWAEHYVSLTNPRYRVGGMSLGDQQNQRTLVTLLQQYRVAVLRELQRQSAQGEQEPQWLRDARDGDLTT